MALVLKRITDPYYCVKCDITRKIIHYGNFYYEDDEDGLIVDAGYYQDRKMQQKYEEAYMNPELMVGQDVISYQTMIRQKEREFLDKGLLNRPIAGKSYATKGGDNNARK